MKKVLKEEPYVTAFLYLDCVYSIAAKYEKRSRFM